MWAIVILIYLIFAAAILALTFRKRKLYPVEITKKKYILVGTIACAGLLLIIVLLALLLLIVFPYFQKLLFGKDSIIFLSFVNLVTDTFIILLCFLGLFLGLVSFYLIIIFQHNTTVWVFYRDLKEPSLKFPDFNKPTDFSDNNIQCVTKKLNFILRILALVSLVFLLIGDLPLLSYGKFTDNEIIRTTYGSFYTFNHSYEDIDKVEISIARSPNGKNPVLDYFIYFNDGNEMEMGDEKLIEIHTLLKNKNAPFVYLSYTHQQYEELISHYTGARKETYEFVLSDNPNQESIYKKCVPILGTHFLYSNE